MTHAATPPQQNRTRLIVLIALALVGIGLIAFAVLRGMQPAASPSITPGPMSPSVGGTVDPTSGSPAASTTPSSAPASAPGDCAAPGAGFVPDRFTIESLGADEPVVALGLDSKGNIAAPPLNEPRMASWWNEGPKPGSDKGKAVLSIHTYRNGKALGNEMYAGGENQLKPGDLIKLYGPDGKVQCYEFTEAKKVWVKDYDPESDIMVDFEGDPMLAIIICWDFNKGTEDWDSRVFFYAKPVTA